MKLNSLSHYVKAAALMGVTVIPSLLSAANGLPNGESSTSHAAESPFEGMPPPENAIWQSVAMFAIAFAFFYLILWRPEQRRRKEIEQKRAALRKGDKVNSMGIIGTVAEIRDQTLVLRMVDGSKIEVLKAAINDVIPEGAEGVPAAKE